MLRERPIRTCFALFLAFCLPETGLVRAEGFPTDLVSPGLLASDLMVGDQNIRFLRTQWRDRHAVGNGPRCGGHRRHLQTRFEIQRFVDVPPSAE